jgi:intracellular septation protein A
MVMVLTGIHRISLSRCKYKTVQQMQAKEHILVIVFAEATAGRKFSNKQKIKSLLLYRNYKVDRLEQGGKEVQQQGRELELTTSARR